MTPKTILVFFSIQYGYSLKYFVVVHLSNRIFDEFLKQNK